MPTRFATYDVVESKKIEAEMLARYGYYISSVESLGFGRRFTLRDEGLPLTAPLYFFFGGERVHFGWKLQAITYEPVLLHDDGVAFASVSDGGALYISLMDDETMLYTHSYSTGSSQDSEYGRRIHQYCRTHNMADAWQLHQNKLTALEDGGRAVAHLDSVHDIIRIKERSATCYGDGEIEESWQKHYKSGKRAGYLGE